MGMESVKLTKPWLVFTAGDTVEVDPLRAQWLRDNGYSAARSVLKIGETDLTPHVVRAELELGPPTEAELRPPPFPSIRDKHRRKGD